jgi:formiminotetrahydrofolate cyclodeaminase
MMFENDTLKQFCDKTAAPDAIPGGGSVSALAGALAAALAAMVAGLTLTKEKFAAVAPQMEALRRDAADLQSNLLAAVERDSESYQAVLAAFRLPKGTQTEIRIRTAAIQEAFKGACNVPLQVAEMAGRVADLAVRAARDGNRDLITDAGVSALLARAAGLGALMNVRVNLAAVNDNDNDPAVRMDQKIKQIKQEIIEKEREILEIFPL